MRQAAEKLAGPSLKRPASSGSVSWPGLVAGLLMVASALALFLVDPLDLVLAWQTSMQEGTMGYKVWQQPPDAIFLRVYIFNVTNGPAFLSGEEKLRVQEVGPYVYREVATFENFTLSNGTASFTSRRHLVFEPELSRGDPAHDVLLVPNLPLLGAAAMLSNSALVTNLALRSLAAFLNAKLLLNLTAQELLWGYDDRLISLANSIVPSFVDFQRLGLLDRMYAGQDQVTMRAGWNSGPDAAQETLTGIYSLETYNGYAGFPQWGHGSSSRVDSRTGDLLPSEMPCDTLRGAFEGVMFPRKMAPGTPVYLYRRGMCRTLPLRYDGTARSARGYRYYNYRLPAAALGSAHDADSPCFCSGRRRGCIGQAFSSLQPCFYHLPLALSLPHMMKADADTRALVEGMRPDPALHESYFKLQPDLGVPLEIRCRLQINLMVGSTRLALTRRFNNMALPILWIDIALEELPPHVESMMFLALTVAPIAQAVVLALLAVVGAGLAALSLLRPWLARRRLVRPPPVNPPTPLPTTAGR